MKMHALLLLSTLGLAHAQESIPGVETTYRDVKVSDGATLTAMIARPEGVSRPLHPILFAQWVSCGSLEYRKGSNAREVLAALARESGHALLRVERSARSNGPVCESLDFDTELAHYIDAYLELLDAPEIDAGKVFVYGSSLGSNTAPLLALALQEQGFNIAGLMVQGGGGVSYLERMLAFEQHYLDRRPDAVGPADRQKEYIDRVRFYVEYFNKGRLPDAIAEDDADMARVRNDILGMGEDQHYGRPFAWHQQLASKNFLQAWSAIRSPVLVIFNEYDQFESRYGHERIVDTVNRLRPGSATLVRRPGVGHSDNRYGSIEAAYAFDGGIPAWREAAGIMLDWLNQQTIH